MRFIFELLDLILSIKRNLFFIIIHPNLLHKYRHVRRFSYYIISYFVSPIGISKASCMQGRRPVFRAARPRIYHRIAPRGAARYASGESAVVKQPLIIVG